MSADDEIGEIRHSLHVPALAYADYVRIQKVILKTRPRRPLWKRLATVLLPSLVLGAFLGYAGGTLHLNGEIWFGDGEEWFLDGGDLLLIAVVLVLLTMAGTGALIGLYQTRLLRYLHAASGNILGAHVLRFGDDGILWRNQSRAIVTPWAHITGLQAGPALTLIFADRVSLYWLQEEVLAALPDRAGLMAFIRSKLPPAASTG